VCVLSFFYRGFAREAVVREALNVMMWLFFPGTSLCHEFFREIFFCTETLSTV
jgi:hypothetical protein